MKVRKSALFSRTKSQIQYLINHLFPEDRRNSAEERRLIQQLSKDEFDEETLMQQISMLQLKLDDSRKNVQTEKEYVTLFLKKIISYTTVLMPLQLPL